MTITPIPFQPEPIPATQQGFSGPSPYPLISCIMPTAGRPAFVARSVQMFVEQDYPNKELVIVFNKDTDLPAMRFPSQVKLVRSSAKITGAKRNEACRQAAGAIIAHWDDDDIFNTARLTQQSLPIRLGEADIAGMNNFRFYEQGKPFAWLAAPALFRSLFTFGVATGSIMFSRLVWEHLAAYPNLSLGEDTGFVQKLVKKGAVIAAVNGYDHMIYVRHTTNTWHVNAASYFGHAGWKQVALPPWLTPGTKREDAKPMPAKPAKIANISYTQWRKHRNVWAALQHLQENAPYKVIDILYTAKKTTLGNTKKPADYPLISCVMPTAGRAQFIAQSIHYFLLQDYPNKELIIVYNKDTDLPDIQFPPSVRLVKATTKILGGKRNEGNRHARGPIIAQWDDDDVYNVHRLTTQASP